MTGAGAGGGRGGRVEVGAGAAATGSGAGAACVRGAGERCRGCGRGAGRSSGSAATRRGSWCDGAPRCFVAKEKCIKRAAVAQPRPSRARSRTPRRTRPRRSPARWRRRCGSGRRRRRPAGDSAAGARHRLSHVRVGALIRSLRRGLPRRITIVVHLPIRLRWVTLMSKRGAGVQLWPNTRGVTSGWSNELRPLPC